MGSDEHAWWMTAPLDESGRRDLGKLPTSILTALIDNGMALARHAVRMQRRALRNLLGGAEDLDQQLAIWILEAAVTYNPARGPWAAHLVQRVRQLVADRWRADLGRPAIRLLNQAREESVPSRQQVDVNRICSLLLGARSGLESCAEPVYEDEGIEHIAEWSVRAEVTRALLDAGFAPGAQQPRLQRALVSYLLRELHGLPRRRLANCGIHHRTITALDHDLQRRVRELVGSRP